MSCPQSTCSLRRLLDRETLLWRRKLVYDLNGIANKLQKITKLRGVGVGRDTNFLAPLWEAPWTGWLKTTVIYFFTIQESRSLKSRCQQGQFLLEALKENLLMSLSWVLVVASNPWLIATSLHSLPPSSPGLLPVCCSVFSHTFLQGHQLLDWEPTVIWFDLILVNYICKIPVFKYWRSYSEVPHGHEFWRHTTQPNTGE